MCAGLSLSWRELPQAMIERHRLEDRAIVRNDGAEKEYRFLYRDRRPLIPVWHCDELCIYPWGSGGTKLPRTGWVAIESLKDGRWRELAPEEVEIPATFGFDRGIWFQVPEGIKGMLVRDECGRPHVYMLTQQASHYYQVMTRNYREPVFIGNQI